MARIIVIGAGVAGLAAAARMSGTSNHVTVLDRNPSPGGALNWAGPCTLTLPAVLRDLFVKTGGRKAGSAGALEDVVDLRPVDPVRTYRFPDGSRLDLPNTSRGATKNAFDAAFGHPAGEAWLRILDHGSRAWSLIRPTLVEVADAGRADLWRLLGSTSARRALAPRRTLRQIAEVAGVTDPRMHRILDAFALDAGATPAHAPAVLTIRPYIEHAFGGWRIVGGLPELATAMYERCLKRGVEFRLGVEADSIESGSVTLADGEHLAADVIVAAVDTQILARLTGARPTNVAYSPSRFSVRLGGPAGAALPHESVLFGAHDESTIHLHAAPETPTEWIAHVEAPLHGSRPGHENWDAEGVSATYAQNLARAIARRLDRSEDSVTIREFFSPADRERLTAAPGGSVNGPAVTSLSTAILRSTTVQPMKGLLHIGASSRPGPGLAFAALSAWNAAEVLKPTRV